MTILDLFLNGSVRGGLFTRDHIVSTFNGNLFGKYMVFDVSGDTFELPYHVQTSFGDKEYDYVSVLIPISSTVVTNRQLSSCLKTFCNVSETTYNRGLAMVIIGGCKYYGCPGLILDENKEILLMETIEYKRVENGFEKQRVILHINPKVFLRETLLEKNIVKKIIPYCCQNTVRWRSPVNPTFKVVIEKCKNMYSPQSPIVNPNMTTQLSQCIKDNIDLIL